MTSDMSLSAILSRSSTRLVHAHDGRFRAGRTSVKGNVLHTSEGAVDADPTDDAEQLCKFLQTPPTATNVASYTVVFDDDSYIRVTGDDETPYSAPPWNNTRLHGCFPAKAALTRDQWLAYPHRSRITVAAAWCIETKTKFNTALKQIGVAEALQDASGICDHHVVTDAFHKSTHTDVGVSFPWDIFFQDMTLLQAPPVPAPLPDYGLPIPDANGLGLGDSGPEVVKLQNLIKFWWPQWYPFNVDGSFGPKTQLAVAAMQGWLNDNNYGPTGKPDGVYNWLERSALQKFYQAVGVKP